MPLRALRRPTGFRRLWCFYSNERRSYVWLLPKRPAGCFEIRFLIFSIGKCCLGSMLTTCVLRIDKRFYLSYCGECMVALEHVFPSKHLFCVNIRNRLTKALRALWGEAIMASAFISILALMDAEARVGFAKPARASAFISLLYFY